MTFEELNAAEAARETKLQTALDKARKTYDSAVSAASEAYDAAVAKARDAALEDFDAITKAFDNARAKEVSDRTAAANAEAGLEPDGSEKKVPPGQTKRKIAVEG